MKEPLESLSADPTPQDKKNYATEGAEPNFISANNFNTDSITIVDEKQSRISDTVNFFNLLYSKITVPHFAYLWTKQRGIFSFAINDETQRIDMAKKAVQLSDCGVDVWHSVNTVCVKPTDGKRGDEFVVSYQIACVVDIDIRSKAHKGDPAKLAADFDEAKSFLPFTPSLIIHSGYGLHAYYIFDTPIAITDLNREQLKRRNNLLLDVIRSRANGIIIDGVGDLPRVMRTPSTFNYKLGKDNAPLCHIVEDSGLRFSPAQLDEKLNAMILAETKKAQPTTTPTKSAQTFNEDFSEDRDFNIFRVRRMLDFIPPSSLTYDEWLAVGMALKNTGCDCSDWENWSRADERFKDGECQYKWNGFNRDGYDIGTLYHLAELNGYDAKEIYHEWKTLQRTFRYATMTSGRNHTVATEGSSRSIYSTPERSDFSMGNDNKGSPKLQALMTTREVADELDVSVSTVKHWRTRKLLGCYFFSADEKHGDTLYYYRERVEQLKAVYQKGILQNMYKLAKKNPEPISPDYFQKSDPSRRTNNFGEELSFRHAGFFTVDEVADIFGVDDSTVERWVKSGILSEDMKGHNGDLYFGIDNILEFTPPSARDSKIAELKAELRKVTKAIADLDKEKDAALKLIRDVESFDSDTVFAEEVIKAAAFARLFDKKVFSDFRGAITSRNRNAKDKKVSVTDWLAEIRDKAIEISSRKNDLLAQRNEIQAQIRSLSFVAQNDDLQNFVIPSGYSVSENGIEKIAGEDVITVCRRPVIIKSKAYNIEEKIYKLELAYMTQDGELETLPPTEAAIIFNRNKLVDLANNGLPVTSSNATLLVDYFDAFNAQNEKIFPIKYTVPRCGWYHFNGKDCFVDPRKDCSIANKNKNINVVVDSMSQFAKSLQQRGSIKAWKKIYKLAKKSPVARMIVAAAVAPILLKILNERNFLLYIYAPTRAGKTTALYLGASAVGSEKMIRSFDATKNGLAGAAADVNDYAFLVDEKQVADNRLKEAFDNLVYALANGIGRTKLNKDSSLQKMNDWRTIPIMTGETLLLPDNVTGGANTRLLTIAAPKIILDAESCKEIRNSIKDNYGLAFPLVIDQISAIGVETLKKAYNSIVADFDEKYPDVLDEYRRYMAIITLADALLNAALGENFDTALQDAKLNATQIFPLVPTTAEISDTAREKDFVLGIIAQNQSRFIGGNIPLDRMQAICGKLDDPKFIYIAAKFLQDTCSADGFDYKKLVDDLVADGFFVPADTIEKGRKTPLTTVKKQLGKVNTRCYRISRTAFDG